MSNAIDLYTNLRDVLRRGYGTNQIHHWWVTPRATLQHRTPDEYISDDAITFEERGRVLMALAEEDVASILDPYCEVGS